MSQDNNLIEDKQKKLSAIFKALAQIIKEEGSGAAYYFLYSGKHIDSEFNPNKSKEIISLIPECPEGNKGDVYSNIIKKFKSIFGENGFTEPGRLDCPEENRTEIYIGADNLIMLKANIEKAGYKVETVSGIEKK